MSINNPWRLCKVNPPPQFVRLEIKTRDNDRYIGYRYGKDYFETVGNYIIKDPYKWKFVPRESRLWEDIRKRIFLLSNGDTVENY